MSTKSPSFSHNKSCFGGSFTENHGIPSRIQKTQMDFPWWSMHVSGVSIICGNLHNYPVTQFSHTPTSFKSRPKSSKSNKNRSPRSCFQGIRSLQGEYQIHHLILGGKKKGLKTIVPETDGDKDCCLDRDTHIKWLLLQSKKSKPRLNMRMFHI